MNVRFFFLLFAVLPICGCFTPVSIMYETAHSLEPGESNLIVAGAVNPETEASNQGASVTAIYNRGVTSNMDMRLRVEKRFEEDLYIQGVNIAMPYTFLEASPKWSKNSGQFAFALPLQMYASLGESIFSVDPRFIFTKRDIENNIELTGVLRSQIAVVEGEFGIIPGASIGLGISEDFDKQVIRLEVGGTATGVIQIGLGIQTKLK